MKNVDLSYIARTIAGLSGIPIRVFDGDTLTEYQSMVRLVKDPLETCRAEIFQLTDHVAYHITPRFMAYGVIRSGDVRIVVGPTAQVPLKDQQLKELAFQAGVPAEETAAFTDSMKQIVPLPLESLLMMLCSVNYMISGEKLELKDVAIREELQESLKAEVEQQRTEARYAEPKVPALHNTLELEETLMDIVRRGDTAALREWAAAAPPVLGGLIAPDQLRQQKNTLIVTATLASRAAIRGGLAAEDALQLSDAYIRRAEVLNSQSAIVNLQFNMVLEFTEQVEKVRYGGTPTRLVTAAANYVRRHLSEPIRTEDMAKEFYLSRPYLSSRFKKESGMSLTDFILKEKTEEAKRLLRYSDRSAAAISSYLGFSSPGHFARVFGKYAGLTPNAYREKYR
ncbi:MAG: helix-turn-helix domain-containing protein [Lachnospiraceae bacterium]|nr:helix-turn-helix domain-containing protein [Lachnospiraceae bacterium]